MKIKTLLTPDLGDFENVPVIELYVSAGDVVQKDDLILAIESDKATMDIPSTEDGEIEKLLVMPGDTVTTGQPLAEIRVATSGTAREEQTGTDSGSPDLSPDRNASARANEHAEDAIHTDLLVLGAGPGGYTAAFRAADLGLDVVLVERYPALGGVCLNVGCIPSKALLHVAKMISEHETADEMGLRLASPEVDIHKTMAWKDRIVSQLTKGLSGLAERRGVRVVQGNGMFESKHALVLDTGRTVHFDQAIIAAGSEAVRLPETGDDPRIMSSTGALAPDAIPGTILIVGGGIIGLEMATVYHALGTRVHIVEMLDHLMPGIDPDLVRPLMKRIRNRYAAIWLSTRVIRMQSQDAGIRVDLSGKDAPGNMLFDRVLVCVGRKPNGLAIGAECAGVAVTERGFITVDKQQRTNVPNIYAVGDIVGEPMLAHKAVHEGRVAAEVAAGLKSGFEARVIPGVSYTDPEIAWVGLTEMEAREREIPYGKGLFPWAASGRSLTQGRSDGITKLLFDPDSHRIIGAGITGPHAGDLIAEATLAMEMNADARDIALTIHPHPTLSETLGFAAEAFEGTITDLYLPKIR